jgi:membrane-associated protease RseP (regulator of RpoE activity)
VKIAGVDLRTFEFDYDLTWHVFFLNADETIYGRYGGRDAASAEGRISTTGLRYAMGRALEAHRQAPPPRPLTGQQVRAEDYAAAGRHRGCIHCHNVNEFRRADALAAGTWDRNSIWVYPLPENVGLTLEIDVGNRVNAVTAASPAARAGLQRGDSVESLAGYRVSSQGDVMYALHKSPPRGSIPVTWVRDGKPFAGTLEVADGWRKTNVTWRPSMFDVLPTLPFSGDDLTPTEKRMLGLPEKQAAFRQDESVNDHLAAAGVRKGDVIVGFDGHTVDGTMVQLLGFVRRNYLVGDEITVNVLRDGKRLDLRLKLK